MQKKGTTELYVAKEFVGSAKDVENVFLPEARSLPMLDHPNCIKSYKVFGKGESGSVIVIEFVKGMDLSKAVLNCEKYEIIPKHTLLDFLLQMAEAVRYLH